MVDNNLSSGYEQQRIKVWRGKDFKNNNTSEFFVKGKVVAFEWCIGNFTRPY